MERLLDQLTGLSQYAHSMFVDIANQTVALQERALKLQERIAQLTVPLPGPPQLSGILVSFRKSLGIR